MPICITCNAYHDKNAINRRGYPSRYCRVCYDKLVATARAAASRQHKRKFKHYHENVDVPKNVRAAAEKRKGNSYVDRNHTLRQLGFASYQEYLESDLWRKVRLQVYVIKGRTCRMCLSKPATCVHHNRYHLNDLTGRKLKFLEPLCDDCHKKIEFEQDGEKIFDVGYVKYRFKRLRNDRLKQNGVRTNPGR